MYGNGLPQKNETTATPSSKQIFKRFGREIAQDILAAKEKLIALQMFPTVFVGFESP